MPTYAFYGCAALSSVGFMSQCFTSLTAIPDYAFCNCSGIKTLSSLPSRIKRAGTSAFRYTGLTGIQDLRSTGLTSFGNYALANCASVKEFKLSSNIGTATGSYLLYQNTGLSALDIPSSLTAIPTYFAYGCTGLKSITIPSKVQIIRDYAFRGC